MRYFKDILKTFTTAENKEIIKLCRNVRFKSLDNENYLIEYYIKDGDTPENLAYDLYGDYDLWWIICLSSGIFNRFDDWPMTDTEINDYYTYLVSEGELTGTVSEKNTLISENDLKRTIQILDPKYVGAFLFNVQQTLEDI